MSEFAKHTSVSPEKSKMEIETILKRYGATSFASGWSGTSATIVFEASGRRVKFVLPLPDWTQLKYKYKTVPQREQLIRQKWRCLALAIKAKLEVVSSGIATFEEEFMAHVVLPNGETVGKWMEPQIQSAYQNKKMPLMLGSGE